MSLVKTVATVGGWTLVYRLSSFMRDILQAKCLGAGMFADVFSLAFKFANILRKIFGDSVYIYPLPDIGVGNNSKWGDYVLENVEKRFGMLPDLLISGKEERRISWFDSIAGVSVAELYIPKTIDISATKMREHLINGEFELWKEYTSDKLWGEYGKLRECVCAAKDNLYTDSI